MYYYYYHYLLLDIHYVALIIFIILLVKKQPIPRAMQQQANKNWSVSLLVFSYIRSQ